uniref:dolichyl-phosphate-mannose--protein mannosyltransferase n=1 Tax=Oryzias sinensis TaxID=183150 RepID=A0A8C7XXQ8_9TELE
MTSSRREKAGRERPAPLGAGARYAALVAACALCYGNSLHGELVHDDVWAIVNNPDVRAGSSLRSIFSNDFWGKKMADNTSHKSYRPLCVLTFKLNVVLGGLTPLYFHLVNVCLHICATCLLLHTCERHVFQQAHLAFITALLFAVHPVHTEAVSGIVGRADVLACVLFLLAFLSYTRSVGAASSEDSLPGTESPAALLISLLLGTCAMLVKETGITVFGVCLLYDALDPCHYFQNKITPPPSHLTCSPGVAHIKHACAAMTPACPLVGRTLTFLYLLVFNAWLLLAPAVLCYDWQVGSIPLVESLGDVRNVATGLLVVLLVSSLHFLKLPCAPVVGILFLGFPFIPASNLFFRVGFVVAERVLYMPSMGYCILVTYGLGRLCSTAAGWCATLLKGSMLLLLLLFSWKTVQQNTVWLSREALFRSGIQTLPHNAKVHYNYANFLKDNGRQDEAVYHYNTALRLYPRHASALNNLGTLTNSLETAEHYYRKALDINPQHNRALFNLGNLLRTQGKDKEAEALLKNSIRYGPHFADAFSSLASLYADQERFVEAKEVYIKGIKNCPDSSDLHNNYGVFLVNTGEGELAAAHYQRAIQLKPAHYVAMANLGRLLRASNENDEAESWFKRALQIARKVDVLTPLGALYYNTGRFYEALQVYREAAALQPRSTDILLALAQVLVMTSHSTEAEKMTQDIISREAGCIECYRLLSAIYSKRGNHTEAVQALDRALQQNPADLTVRAELHFSRGNQLREMQQLDEALESYKLAVELKPDQSQAWMNMGGIQHIKGDYATARTYYQQALLLNPTSKLLKENLAKLDRLEKKTSGAT